MYLNRRKAMLPSPLEIGNPFHKVQLVNRLVPYEGSKTLPNHGVLEFLVLALALLVLIWLLDIDVPSERGEDPYHTNCLLLSPKTL